MMTLEEKFSILGVDNAPGQEVRQNSDNFDDILLGENLAGRPVDFSHGDVDAFPPIPGAQDAWNMGFAKGGKQAYTEYRGDAQLRNKLADRLGKFTGEVVSSDHELIITPGTQGALFLALGATVTDGTKVAIVEPDYFANRKLVIFFGGDVVPIQLKYLGNPADNGPDLEEIKTAFKQGTKIFVFSTPNNPTGLIYSHNSISKISEIAVKYNVTLVVDQLYSRLLYQDEKFTHLCSLNTKPENLITIMGPSKTESISGFRLGVAFGTSNLIDRMEKLQAIVSLRAAGYNQSVLETWFQEPEGWLENRIQAHEAIRDDLLEVFRNAGIQTAKPQAGSYLFPKLPKLSVDMKMFTKLLRQQANVTVTPGTEFAPELKHSIRLNFSQDHNAAVAAAKRIVKMVEVYKK